MHKDGFPIGVGNDRRENTQSVLSQQNEPKLYYRTTSYVFAKAFTNPFIIAKKRIDVQPSYQKNTHRVYKNTTKGVVQHAVLVRPNPL